MTVSVRTVEQSDFENWNVLWQGYVSFLKTKVADDITRATYDAMLVENSNIGGLLAVDGDGTLVGFVNFVFHPTTFALKHRAYLEDLYTAPDHRGKGIARKLIEAVAQIAEARGSDKLYWHTEEDNYAGRMLYDQMGTKTHIVYTRKF